ncbi:ragulator complex protein LAMTOR5 [Acrasis kona]|uniref:Late endosomal/lysosomal adaptor and MAPK and MTOR activator 5 n=1 Tax=Acrasis kona TaxID=1008807 RepID=A0AAW2Z0J4_9EUKA
MDTTFGEGFNKISSSESDIIGLICADSNGLCIKKQGEDVSSSDAGYLASIARRAQILSSAQDSRPPVILIEGEKKQILVQNQGQLTVGIYKKPFVQQTPQIIQQE